MLPGSSRRDGGNQRSIGFAQAAGLLLVEEAGGTVTDFQGNPYHPGDHELVASNTLIHDELCRVGREIAALRRATGARGWEKNTLAKPKRRKR